MECFQNRELSWLEFNNRVLEEAVDKKNPLLERAKFLAITASNLDEFLMIRVSGLKKMLKNGKNSIDLTGMDVERQLFYINEKIEKLQCDMDKCYLEITELLQNEKIENKSYSKLKEEEKEEINLKFKKEIYPYLIPVAIGPHRKFPKIKNKKIYILFHLRRACSKDLFLLIEMPENIDRIVKIGTKKQNKFILWEEIVKNCIIENYKDYEILSSVTFRVIRNGEIEFDESKAEDIADDIRKAVKKRKNGFIVKLEMDKTDDEKVKEFLMESLKIAKEDIMETNFPKDLKFLFQVSDISGYDYLKYEDKKCKDVKEFKSKNIFEAIRKKDILLHHPYESFEYVVKFLENAVNDPNVISIRQTIYRTGENSVIIELLKQAALNGKQVSVLVEVKARFDEETNIKHGKELEKYGCYVTYGVIGLKTHAKMLIVARRENGEVKRYAHLGTGNYNDKTAKQYTDFSLFTSKEDYCNDITKLFNIIVGGTYRENFEKVLISPFGIREEILQMIKNEVEMAKKGKEGKIIMKMNSLVDKEMIENLIEASKSGVEIDLIVRGICQLKPGIENLTHNIRIRSIVGRFLEHSRIYYFNNGGEEKIYLASADLMPRNLDTRVEVMFPIEDISGKEKVIKALEMFLKDNIKAREMKNDGKYYKAEYSEVEIISQNEFFTECI